MSGNVHIVNLTGDLIVGRIGEAADALRTALAAQRKMTLMSLSGVTDIDLAGVQLLYSARRQADLDGLALHLTGAVPEIVSRRLLQGGFIRRAVSDGRDLGEQLVGFVTPGDTHA